MRILACDRVLFIGQHRCPRNLNIPRSRCLGNSRSYFVYLMALSGAGIFKTN
jgi:hypothetical protein